MARPKREHKRVVKAMRSYPGPMPSLKSDVRLAVQRATRSAAAKARSTLRGFGG